MNKADQEKIDAAVKKMTETLADKGKVIEAGWEALRISMLPKEASEMQLWWMRAAFFGGAQHLFASIMSFLNFSSEPDERDLTRMNLINVELEQYVAEMKESMKKESRIVT